MTQSAPDALLLIAPGCPHCQQLLEALVALVKAAELGRIEVVNLQSRPELAAQLGVRSVPWLRLGPFELAGQRSLGELRRWIAAAQDPAGGARYLAELLEGGDMEAARAALAGRPQWLGPLLRSLADTELSLQVRLGADALIEGWRGTPELLGLVEDLEALAGSTEARIRSDAAHYLAMAGGEQARAALRRLLADADPTVREQAEEALTDLDAAG